MTRKTFALTSCLLALACLAPVAAQAAEPVSVKYEFDVKPLTPVPKDELGRDQLALNVVVDSPVGKQTEFSQHIRQPYLKACSPKCVPDGVNEGYVMSVKTVAVDDAGDAQAEVFLDVTRVDSTPVFVSGDMLVAQPSTTQVVRRFRTHIPKDGSAYYDFKVGTAEYRLVMRQQDT